MQRDFRVFAGPGWYEVHEVGSLDVAKFPDHFAEMLGYEDGALEGDSEVGLKEQVDELIELLMSVRAAFDKPFVPVEWDGDNGPIILPHDESTGDRVLF